MFESKESMDMLVKNAKERLENQSIANESVGEDVDYYADFYDDEPQANNEHNQDINTPNYNDVDFDREFHTEEYDIDHSGATLWHGGPTKSMIQLWKRQFEGHDVIYVEVMDQKFIVRTPNRHEYKSIVAVQGSNAYNREEMICETVVLWPQQYTWKVMSEKKAGIPSSIAEIVMEKSGFTKEYTSEVL